MNSTDEPAPRRSELTWVLAAMLLPGAAMLGSFYLLPPAWTAPVYAVSKVLILALPLWVVRPHWRRPAWPRPADWIWGLAIGAAVGAAALALYFLALRGRPEFTAAAAAIGAKLGAAGVSTPGRFLLMAAFVSFFNSTLEEYYWRWFAYGRLRVYWGPLAAAAASSALFGVHHFVVLSKYFAGSWSLAAAFSAGTVFGGAIWCWLYQRRGTLYAAWISHLVIDLAVMAVAYDMLS